MRCRAPKAVFLALALAAPAAGQAQDSVTVPLIVLGNRPYVDVTFQRPDGSTRVGRFVIDSGGGGFLMVEPLAVDLGLDWGEPMSENDTRFGLTTTTPSATVGGFELPLTLGRVAVVLGQNDLLPTAPGVAEGLIPGHILAEHHVVLDYPAGTFTIARPGVLTPEGRPMPMPVSAGQGFPRTEVEVDGQTFGFLLDTGASFTMISQSLLERWGDSHPDWPRYAGAFGDAATLGGQTIETMFVPSVTWGPWDLGVMGVTSQQEGTFERGMSRVMTAPIIGSLAGNVLTRFRVELDYPNETLYLSEP